MVKERKPGREKLSLGLRRFEEAVAQAAFGNPVDGATGYRLCLYDDRPRAVATLDVERASEACGGKPCWKAVGVSGYRYRDPNASADGVRRITLKGGGVRKGSVSLRAGNKTAKGQSGLPTGTAAGLSDTTLVTVQILASDAGCFEATLTMVKKANGSVFKAVAR